MVTGIVFLLSHPLGKGRIEGRPGRSTGGLAQPATGVFRRPRATGISPSRDLLTTMSIKILAATPSRPVAFPRMPNNLKSALSTLRASLAEHRAALLSRLPSQALHEAAAAGRQSLLNELTAEVRRRFGLVLEHQIEAKLAQVLKSVSEVELARWIGRLALLPSDHSEWLSVI